MRLSALHGEGVPYIKMMEAGTDIEMPSSYGGYPTPSYGGKPSFIGQLPDRVQRLLNNFIDSYYNTLVERVMQEDVYLLVNVLKRNGIALTEKLENALVSLAHKDTEIIVQKINVESTTRDIIDVIINIGEKTYNIVRTKKGGNKFGLRYNISAYNRRNS